MNKRFINNPRQSTSEIGPTLLSNGNATVIFETTVRLAKETEKDRNTQESYVTLITTTPFHRIWVNTLWENLKINQYKNEYTKVWENWNLLRHVQIDTPKTTDSTGCSRRKLDRRPHLFRCFPCRRLTANCGWPACCLSQTWEHTALSKFVGILQLLPRAGEPAKDDGAMSLNQRRFVCNTVFERVQVELLLGTLGPVNH